MAKLTQSTKSVSEKDIKRDWHLIDMEGKVLGRVITDISVVLQGKNKTNFVPYLDMGDYVVVVNARGARVTGRKATQKTYTRYSGYPGGLSKISLRDLRETKPEEMIRHAVSGMLPKNKLRSRRLSRLFVFEGGDHPYKDKFSSVNK